MGIQIKSDDVLTLRLISESVRSTHTLTRAECAASADVVAAEFERDGVTGPDYSSPVSALLTKAISEAGPDLAVRAAGCVYFLAQRDAAISTGGETENRFFVVGYNAGRLVCARCEHAEEMDKVTDEFGADTGPSIDVAAIKAGVREDVRVDVSIATPIGSITANVQQDGFGPVIESGLRMSGPPSGEVARSLLMEISSLIVMAAKAIEANDDAEVRELTHQAVMRVAFIIAFSVPSEKFIAARHMLFKITPNGFVLNVYAEADTGEYRAVMDALILEKGRLTDDIVADTVRSTLH